VVIVHSRDTAVTQEQIDTMLIHNPRTVFERHGS
jgi:predicted metal-dependent phosphotriesterase family hydrolase